MESEFTGPVNIGSEEMVISTVLLNGDADWREEACHQAYYRTAGRTGRNSDNRLISEKLGWKPTRPLREGMGRPIAGFKNK